MAWYANYRGLEVGKKVRWGNADWKVVGRFTDDGGIAESEAWADARLVQQVWNRGTSFQSVRVRLTENPTRRSRSSRTRSPRIRSCRWT